MRFSDWIDRSDGAYKKTQKLQYLDNNCSQAYSRLCTAKVSISVDGSAQGILPITAPGLVRWLVRPELSKTITVKPLVAFLLADVEVAHVVQDAAASCQQEMINLIETKFEVEEAASHRPACFHV